MCFEKFNSSIKKMNMCDIGLVKLSVLAFTLMLAKLWPPILSLEWYMYGGLFILLALKPLYRVLKK